MNCATVALILTRPGPLRNSLQTLLSTLPKIEIVAEARDLDSLLRLGSELQPDLVLIEAGPPDNGLQEALRQIKRDWTQTCCLVLVDTAQQEQAAAAAGADVVLFKGFRATQLVSVIENLLSGQTSSSSCHPSTCTEGP